MDSTLFVAEFDGTVHRMLAGWSDVVLGPSSSADYTARTAEPAAGAPVGTVRGVVVRPDGAPLASVSSRGGSGFRGILSVEPSMPGVGASDLVVPLPDGSELNVFDRHGRHLKTLDAITRAVLYTFGYDEAGPHGQRTGSAKPGRRSPQWQETRPSSDQRS